MYLIILQMAYDNLVGTVFDLPEKGILVVGRHGVSDIVLRDISVSRCHLQMQISQAELVVRDLGSKNGTRLNGQLLQPHIDTIVPVGSKLQVGEVVLGLKPGAPQQPTVTVDQIVALARSRLNLLNPDTRQPTITSPARQASPTEVHTTSAVLDRTVTSSPVASTPALATVAPEQKETVITEAPTPKHPLIFRGAEIPAEPPTPPQRPVIVLKEVKSVKKQGEEKEKTKKVATKAEKAATAIFPNFMQMPSRIPQSVWHILRFISVTTAVAVCTLAFVVPDLGLLIFWGFFIPLLPLIFFLAPGLWRNICPMATLNQLPRLGGFTRALKLPNWLKEYSYIIGIGLFMVIVPARKFLFSQNGPALGLLMAMALFTAFLMGTLFKGKSGWCSSICPLLPVQRIYGQTPFVTVRNSHCQPCVGCTKNCYDLNPSVAYVTDLHDDPHYINYRKLFAGAFPGLILAFYQLPTPPAISILTMYSQFALYISVSIGAFFALSALLRVSAAKITALYAALAFNLYYWFNLPPFISKVSWLTGFSFAEWVSWSIQGFILLLTLVWLTRTYHKEPLFITKILVAKAGSTRAKLGSSHPRPASSNPISTGKK